MTIQVTLTHYYKTIIILVITTETSKLMVEIYKIKNNLNLPIIDFMGERRNNTYKLRHFKESSTKIKRTAKMGVGT